MRFERKIHVICISALTKICPLYHGVSSVPLPRYKHHEQLLQLDNDIQVREEHIFFEHFEQSKIYTGGTLTFIVLTGG